MSAETQSDLNILVYYIPTIIVKQVCLNYKNKYNTHARNKPGHNFIIATCFIGIANGNNLDVLNDSIHGDPILLV